MKIISIALVVVFLASSGVIAQNNDVPAGFISRVDVFAGAGASFLRGGIPVSTNEVQQRHLKFSYCFGLEFVHQINEKIGISVLPMYEHKGSVYTGGATFFNPQTQTLDKGPTRHEYVYTNYTLPILANFNFVEGLGLQLSAGPFVSYLSKQVIQELSPLGTRGMTDQTEFNRKFEGRLVFRLARQININEHISLTPMLTNLYGMTDTRLVRNYGVTK